MNIDVAKLLGRDDPVPTFDKSLADFLQGKSVLTTGGGGSIGSEICRQALRHGAGKLTLVGRSELGLFETDMELRKAYPKADICTRLADVCDFEAMDKVFFEVHPNIVAHAAANKHVGLCEANPHQAIRNNVMGTRVVAGLSWMHGVEQFVLISTDKAVPPQTSVMGTTKAIAEQVVLSMATYSSVTSFIIVRFGNVIGSSGSCVPIFQKQIDSGGPVTLTDERMTRFFLTIPQAANLALHAAAMGYGGETYILEMGEAVKITDLAKAMIAASGKDVGIVFTGARPGEKLVEELADFDAKPTAHPKIKMLNRPTMLGTTNVAKLRNADGDAKVALKELVPEYVGVC